MTLQVGVGNFAKKGNGTGTQTVTGVVDQDGAAFTPKAIIFLGARQNGTTGATRMCLGFADCINLVDRAIEYQQRGSSGSTTNTEVRGAAKAVTMIENAASATAAEADISAVASGEFTLNWTTNDTNTARIHYLAMGGDGIDDVAVVSQLLPANGGEGNDAVTGVGFQPDLVFLLAPGGSSTANPGSQPDTFTYQWLTLGTSFGAIDAAGGEFALGAFTRAFVTTVDASRVLRADRCIYSPGANQSEELSASFVSMDSDGFTLNVDNVPTADRWIYYALCIKGGAGAEFKVGTFTKSVSTSTPVSDPITGVGFQPAGLVFATAHSTATTIQTHLRATVGFSNAAADGSVTAKIEDNTAGNALDRDLIESNVYSLTKSDDDATSLEASGVVDSLDDDGFTVEWDVNDAVATLYGYVALGQEASVTPTISGAVITYGSLTRTGVNNTPWQLDFDLADADTPGAGALTWELWTGAARTGTKIGEGTATTGDHVTEQFAYNETGLVNGNQTLYLSVDDGISQSADTQLTLKRDDDAPAASTGIEVTPV